MFMYDKDENLFLPVYGPCNVHFDSREGTKITILEDTSYPFDETINLYVKASAPSKRKLMLKIPSWCKMYNVRLNGAEVKSSVSADGYLPVEHTWNNDTLTIFFEMKPAIVKAKDVYFQKEPLRAIECGPLLFALRFPENWTPVKGTPLTPLPADWSWYEASYVSEEKPSQPSFYSINLDELKGGSAIVKKRSESAYPWEDSPLKLEVPMHRSAQAYPVFRQTQKNTSIAYNNPVSADTLKEIIELVPYGCTNLRLTYFTICK